MKRAAIAFAAGCVLLGCGLSHAVEACYHGPLGNPEEPALRPYKWLWRGAKALSFQTGSSLKHGNIAFPVLGTVEGFRGVRRGTLELGESAYKGCVFAPVPEKGHYKKRGKANHVIEKHRLARHSADFLFSWYFFPLLKGVDRYSLEDQDAVEQREAHAAKVREQRKASLPVPEAAGTPVEQAQRQYEGERVKAGKKRGKKRQTGNLLKLAK